MAGFYWGSLEHAFVGARKAEGGIVHLELRHGGTSDEDDGRNHVRDTRFSCFEAVLNRLVIMLNEALATTVMTMNQYNGKDNNYVPRCTKTVSEHKSYGPVIPKGDYSDYVRAWLALPCLAS